MPRRWPRACKRARPDNVVFTYQGDGDLASIGAAEIVHAATRGEKITAIFVNNAIYGMTGGQMAPTTLPGQVTTTTPYGRDVQPCAAIPSACARCWPPWTARPTSPGCPSTTSSNIMEAKKAIKKAFEIQMAGKGFTLVEVLSTCPTNWGMTPQEALKWLQEKMIPQYPLGVQKGGASDMEAQFLVAGFGGQGVLLIGQLLAKAAMHDGMNVSWMPSYGPEMRGGDSQLRRGDQRRAHRQPAGYRAAHCRADEQAQPEKV